MRNANVRMSEINYSLEQLQSEDAGRAHILNQLEQIKNDYRVTGRKVLELGCGNGRNLKIFSTDNDVQGIDGLDAAVEFAKKQGVSARVGNLNSTIDASDASFDLILLLDVLEHLESPDHCLREALRIVRPGGLLVVNVPNHFTLSARLRILRGSGIDSVGFFPGHRDWNYPHLRFFRLHSIRELITMVGFINLDDRSSAFPAIPMGHELRLLGLGRALPRVACRYPDLFCASFFIVAQRP